MVAKKTTHLPDYDIADVTAVKALFEGKADEYQQKRAFKFIIHDLCVTFGLDYVPGSFDETAFRAGKSFVGKVLMGMVKPETMRVMTKGILNASE